MPSVLPQSGGREFVADRLLKAGQTVASTGDTPVASPPLVDVTTTDPFAFVDEELVLAQSTGFSV